jgi:hypothetical protein
MSDVVRWTNGRTYQQLGMRHSSGDEIPSGAVYCHGRGALTCAFDTESRQSELAPTTLAPLRAPTNRN